MWGRWDAGRTVAVQVSGFATIGYNKLTPSPTLAQHTSVNTTPDVFVGLYTDTTTAAGEVWSLMYGGDVNYRVAVPNFPYVENFDVLVGMRAVALDEFSTNARSITTRNYASQLGLPGTFSEPTTTSIGRRWYALFNNFVGPQIGFVAGQHWGRYWFETENKVAVGLNLEVAAFGPTNFNMTQTTTTLLAGIPLAVNAGGPNVAGTLGDAGSEVKPKFAVVPSGNLKIGYDIIPDVRSVTFAYNYLYMSNVGLISSPVPQPPGIRQASVLLQGITFGLREKF